jgi:hypothetical protein
VAGGSGPGTRTVRREVVLERGGRSGVGDEGVDGWQVGCAYERARSAARLRGKKERRGGGGVRPWGYHMARGQSWGLALTVSRPAMTRTRRAQAARHCLDHSALALMGGPLVAVRAERRAGARGPAREENGVAEPR